VKNKNTLKKHNLPKHPFLSTPHTVFTVHLIHTGKKPLPSFMLARLTSPLLPLLLMWTQN